MEKQTREIGKVLCAGIMILCILGMGLTFNNGIINEGINWEHQTYVMGGIIILMGALLVTILREMKNE